MYYKVWILTTVSVIHHCMPIMGEPPVIIPARCVGSESQTTEQTFGFFQLIFFTQCYLGDKFTGWLFFLLKTMLGPWSCLIKLEKSFVYSPINQITTQVDKYMHCVHEHTYTHSLVGNGQRNQLQLTTLFQHLLLHQSL